MTTEQQARDTCVWTLTEPFDAVIWESSCGEAWSFNEGGPEDNSVNFCHKCGGKCTFVRLESEPDDDDE